MTLPATFATNCSIICLTWVASLSMSIPMGRAGSVTIASDLTRTMTSRCTRMSDGVSLVLDHRAGLGRRACHPGGGRQRAGMANPVVADTFPIRPHRADRALRRLGDRVDRLGVAGICRLNALRRAAALGVLVMLMSVVAAWNSSGWMTVPASPKSPPEVS